MKLSTTWSTILSVCVLCLFAAVPVSAQGTRKETSGSRTQANSDSKPRLEVNGKRIKPIADSKTDLVLSFPSGWQTWTLLREFSKHRNINNFGTYTDIGKGEIRSTLFNGPDKSSRVVRRHNSSPNEFGLWLLSDDNGDSVFTEGEALLFSERFLTVGAKKPQHQYFMVYDVSRFKGTGAEYEFETKGSEFETKGDFDFLIFADDSRGPGKFDHDDMIIGLLFGDTTGGGHPPSVICPGDTSMKVCDFSPVCLTGFEYIDPDGDIETVELTGGEFVDGHICFVPHEGINTLTLKVTDRTGQSDSCSVNIDVKVNHPPEIKDQFFSGVIQGNHRQIFFRASDADNDSLRYRLLEGSGEVFGFPGGGYITYLADTSGIYTFVVEADDTCAADTATIEDTVRIIREADLHYVRNSFQPEQVAAGGLVQFSFELQLLDSTILSVFPEETVFDVRSRNFNASLKVEIPDNTLRPGVNVVKSDKVFIPERILGDTLRAVFRLIYQFPDSPDFVRFYTAFDGLGIPVVQMPLVKIVDVVNNAPNSPKVNTGQSFGITCRVANLTSLSTPSFELRMTTDGQSLFDSLVTVAPIVPFDTVTVSFDVIAAAEPNPLEVFHVNVASQIVGEAPSDNAFAPAIVQTPASLRLLWSLVGVRSGSVETGREFALMVRLENDGEATASDGRYSLSTNGVDPGTGDPIVGVIAIDSTLTFEFTAPDIDTSIVLSFDMIERPIDLNVDSTATLDQERFEVFLRVVSQTGDLLVDVEATGPNVIASGKKQDLFTVDMSHIAIGKDTEITVEEITLHFAPLSSDMIDLTRFLDLDQTGFTFSGNLISTAAVVDETLRLSLTGLSIFPFSSERIRFQLSMLDEVRADFELSFTTDDITAVFADESFSPDTAVVISTSGGDELFNRRYATIGNNLQSSFEIENNPFNPLDGAARFAYFLEQPGDIEFRVFTLIGEEVYAMDLREGMTGTEANVRQLISWDGRNNDGSMVNNGVYVAMLLLKSNGEKATLKVAVLK